MIHVLLLESLSETVGNNVHCQGLMTVFVFRPVFDRVAGYSNIVHVPQ